MKFSTAVGLAVVMVLIAAVDRKLKPGYFALVLLYLILAAILPWLFVPIGVVIVLGEIFLQGTTVPDWISNLGKPAVT